MPGSFFLFDNILGMDIIQLIINFLFPSKKPEVKLMSTPRTATLKRTNVSSEATMGVLTLSWVEHDTIHTLENPERDTTKDSSIPEGTYKCVPYSGTKYKDVYLLENVPGRSAILIHWGNTEKDTEGCILVGNKTGKLGSVPAVLESKLCFERLRSLIGDQPFELTIEK